MDITKYMAQKDEKPLDNIPESGGFCSIFRTIGCIGDSLSSGEFESVSREGYIGWHDFYEYSWGQYMARTLGSKVYNFSKGGMTAKEFVCNFGDKTGYLDKDKMCQCYILALGVNDIGDGSKLGTIDDIENPDADTFVRYYANIIVNIKRKNPQAKFFLMNLPSGCKDAKRTEFEDRHALLIGQIADKLKNCYVLDFRKYAPVYNDEFKKNFYLRGHLNPAGYALTAKMVMAYIDYIVRNNPADFRQVGFIGTEFYDENYK